MKKNDLASAAKDYIVMTVGAAIVAFAYLSFYIPNNIVPGGLTGIATIFYYLFRLPIGIVVLALNIPIFIIGWRSIGWAYIIRSIYCTAVMSVLLDVLPLPQLTDNFLLASVFGGVLTGLGLGLVFKSNSSTGGVDIIAKVINRYKPHLSLGYIIFIVDIIVISTAALIFGIEQALYALIGVFIAQKTTDVIIDGARRARAYYVVSKSYSEIAEHVMEKMNRGATLIMSKGMYSGKEQPMLLCIIRPQEIGAFIRIVQSIDNSAFIFVADIHEVMGEGFTRDIEKPGHMPKNKKNQKYDI